MTSTSDGAQQLYRLQRVVRRFRGRRSTLRVQRKRLQQQWSQAMIDVSTFYALNVPLTLNAYTSSLQDLELERTRCCQEFKRVAQLISDDVFECTRLQERIQMSQRVPNAYARLMERFSTPIRLKILPTVRLTYTTRPPKTMVQLVEMRIGSVEEIVEETVNELLGFVLPVDIVDIVVSYVVNTIHKDVFRGECILQIHDDNRILRNLHELGEGRVAVTSCVLPMGSVWDLWTGSKLLEVEFPSTDNHLDPQTHNLSKISCYCVGPDGVVRNYRGFNDDHSISVYPPKMCGLDPLGRLIGHTEMVKYIAASRDGKVLVSGSDDTTVRMWDVETEKCVRVFKGHTKSVNSVTVFADQIRMFSGSYDNTIRIWNMLTGECIRRINVGELIIDVSLFENNRYIISGGCGKLLVWDVETGECVKVVDLEGSISNIHCLQDGRVAVQHSAWTPNNTYISIFE